MNRGVGFIMGLASGALFLFFIPTQTWFNSLGVIVLVNATALFAALVSTTAFWVVLTALGFAVATAALIKDAKDEDKIRSRLSENDSMN